MPIKWKEGTLVCMACGLVLLNGKHDVDECLKGDWCRQLPMHMPDMPHQDYRSTATSSGAVITASSF